MVRVLGQEEIGREFKLLEDHKELLQEDKVSGAGVRRGLRACGGVRVSAAD